MPSPSFKLLVPFSFLCAARLREEEAECPLAHSGVDRRRPVVVIDEKSAPGVSSSRSRRLLATVGASLAGRVENCEQRVVVVGIGVHRREERSEGKLSGADGDQDLVGVLGKRFLPGDAAVSRSRSRSSS